METLSQKKVKARKDHKCNYCCEVINSGEIYQNSSHVYDGTVYTWKAHQMCCDIASHLDMYSWCDEGVTQEDFHTFIREKYNDLMIGNEDYDAKHPKPCFKEVLDYVCTKEMNQ